MRQLSKLRRTGQPGHLREPCGRKAVKKRDHFSPVRLAAQAPERLQNRDIRLHLAAAFQALAAADAHARRATDSLQERIQEEGFPNSGLARDTDELPLPPERSRKRVVQTLHLLFAFDEYGHA